jgi:acetylornithine/succinyldiaminopimelate/putrescine aminotransferase
MSCHFFPADTGLVKMPKFAHNMNQRSLFLQHVGQTSTAPLALSFVKAEGCIMWDETGRPFIDLISGISVCNVGHRHPKVVQAIKDQADQYLHLLVYGELVETPQVVYASRIASLLPTPLEMVYFTGSGSEATEGAMKLAKRVTGRPDIVAFNHSYHGSTQGALSIMGDEYWRNAFRPLLPGVDHLEYGSISDLFRITERTACVVAETIQAEAGVNPPSMEWMRALRRRCDETGTLLVLDEIQVGFGRTGHLWGFEAFGIHPDILLLGKALGGGMPLGAFVASRAHMMQLTDGPILGHITTFGGHPVCCAAGLAGLEAMMEEGLLNDVARKAELLTSLLIHPRIRAVRSAGLLMAAEFGSFEENKKIIDRCIEKGLLTDWFLFAAHCMRIAPPLTISDEQIDTACRIIREACDEV